jgi:hemin uptake protein HemP
MSGERLSRPGSRNPGPTSNVAGPTPSATSSRERRVCSSELIGRDGQLVIDHGGREYRLRITSTGKLILTA